MEPANQGVVAQNKVFFEEFYIHDIGLKFSFKSSPIMFRDLAMNQSLKFLIVLLSNLKKAQINFTRMHQNQSQM
jgi:hypothetical protein